MASPEPEHCCLLPSGEQVVGVSGVVMWVLLHGLAKFVGLGDNLYLYDCLVGLVVKASASRVEDPGFNYRLHCGDFHQVESYQ